MNQTCMQQYFLPEELVGLEGILTLESLLQIALQVASRMPKPLCIVSGPITTGGSGSVGKNIKFFNAAVEVIKDKGYRVFEQMIFHDAMTRITIGQPFDEGHANILNKFYKGFFGSGYISTAIFLPGWETSKGAFWERNFLGQLGIQIIDFSAEWLKEVEA